MRERATRIQRTLTIASSTDFPKPRANGRPIPFLRLCLNESAVDADGETCGWFGNWRWTIHFAE